MTLAQRLQNAIREHIGTRQGTTEYYIVSDPRRDALNVHIVVRCTVESADIVTPFDDLEFSKLVATVKSRIDAITVPRTTDT